MAWTWRLYDDTGADASGGAVPESPEFPTQAEAETWIGEVWRDLLEAGVEAVSLCEDGREVYGPMSLRPAD